MSVIELIQSQGCGRLDPCLATGWVCVLSPCPLGSQVARTVTVAGHQSLRFFSLGLFMSWDVLSQALASSIRFFLASYLAQSPLVPLSNRLLTSGCTCSLDFLPDTERSRHMPSALLISLPFCFVWGMQRCLSCVWACWYSFFLLIVYLSLLFICSTGKINPNVWT